MTPLHGGHVGLLCTAGMLNGVFGDGEMRHIANWQSRKYTKTWQEEEDGKDVHHTREYFAHECTLLWVGGLTQILTHEPPNDDADAPPEIDAEAMQQFEAPERNVSVNSNIIVMPVRNPTGNGGH